MSLFSEKNNPGGKHSNGASEEKKKQQRDSFPGKAAENLGMNMSEEKKKRKKIVKIVSIIVVCVFILAVIALVAFLLWSRAPETESTGLIVQSSTPEPVVVETTPQPAAKNEIKATATPEPTPEPEISIRKENVYTILVAGHDRAGLNTDTLMVVRMDCDAKTVNAVSIPRDTLVNVPWNVKKINSVYGTWGKDGLVSCVEDLVGFPIDNYVIVNTFIFQQLIDAIGGIYFEVPFYMIYDDPMQNLHIYLEPGYQLLNGNQAEQLVRFRKNNDGSGYGTGDIGRIETQHAFLKAAADQILSLQNVKNLPEIIRLITENTDTDLTSGNIAFYVQEFLGMDKDSLNLFTMPFDNVYILGGSYVSIRIPDWIDMINLSLNPYNVDVSEENLDILASDGYSFYSTTGSAPGFNEFYDYTNLG